MHICANAFVLFHVSSKIMYSFIGLLWLLRIRHRLNYEVPQRIFFALT